MIVRNAHSARVVSPCRRQTHTQTSVAARLTHFAWNSSCQTSSAWWRPGWSRVYSVAAWIVSLVERDDGVDLGAHEVGEDGDGDGERDAERGGAQERTAAERQGSHPRRVSVQRVRRARRTGQPTVVTTVPAGACQTRSSTSSPTRTQPLDTAPTPRRVVVWMAVTAVPVGLS